MDCPRCGEPLSVYTLADREAAACDRCGFLGVPVEIRSDAGERESWEDALARFHGKADGSGDGERDGNGEPDGDGESDGNGERDVSGDGDEGEATGPDGDR